MSHIYSIDRFDTENISGWIYDTRSSTPVIIELLINGYPSGIVKADLYRADLKKIANNGAIAFNIPIQLETRNLLQYLPQRCEFEIRVQHSTIQLEGGKKIFHGSAPIEYSGMVNELGQRLRLSKGGFVVPLSERKPEWVEDLLNFAKQLCHEAKAHRFTLAAAYGTLLGSVRQGTVIPHDDDVDLMFISEAKDQLSAIRDLQQLEAWATSQGYLVYEQTNGQVHISHPNTDLSIDIFLAWFEDDRLNLTFSVHNGPQKQLITPLQEIKINGINLPCPKNPEALLTAIYGPGWNVPDPAFQWNRPKEVEDYFSAIHNYNRGANKPYWNNYYSAEESRTPNNPSQFAVFLLGLKKETDVIIDFGCGAGRDSFFFADKGIQTVGLDYSESAIAKNNALATESGLSKNVKFVQFDASNLYQAEALIRESKEKYKGKKICVYSRFFFHAIDEATEQSALLVLRNLIDNPGSYACLEFRTIEDEFRKKTTPPHYRRYIDVDRFLAKAYELHDLICIYRTEGLGYAVHGEDDAHVARLILIQKHIGQADETEHNTRSNKP